MVLPYNNRTNCASYADISGDYRRSDLLYSRIALTVLPVLLTLFTIFGNACVIIAIRVDKRLTRKRTSILILNLALADLLVGGGVMPLGISQIITGQEWIFGRTLCRVWVALDVICCTASIFTLCIISVDRFIGVTRPLSYSYIVTRGRLWTAVAVVWILSIAVLLTTVQWNDEPCAISHACRVGDELKYVVHSVFMSFFIPLTVILIVHFKIYQVTRRRETSLLHSLPECNGASKPSRQISLSPSPTQKRHLSAPSYYYQKINSAAKPRRNTTDVEFERGSEERRPISLQPQEDEDRRRSSGGSTGSERRFSIGGAIKRTTLRIHYGGTNDDVIRQRKFYSKHKKTAKTLALVVGAFLFCWLPFFVLYLISSTCDDECIPPAAMEAFTWLGYSNSALNPIIYAVSMKTFGGGVRKTLARIASVCSHYPGQRGRTGSSRRSRRKYISRSSSVAASRSIVITEYTATDGASTHAPFDRPKSETGNRRIADTVMSACMKGRSATFGSSLQPPQTTSSSRTQHTGTCVRNATITVNPAADCLSRENSSHLVGTNAKERKSPDGDDKLKSPLENDFSRMLYVQGLYQTGDSESEIEGDLEACIGELSWMGHKDEVESY